MYNEDKKKTKKVKKGRYGFLLNLFRKRKKRLLTDIDKLYNNVMWMEIGLSLLLVLVGIVFLLNPELSINVLSILFGIITILFGVLNIYTYLKRREIWLFKFGIIYGIIAIVLGLLIVINPFTFSQVVTVFIGLYLIYFATIKIDLAVRLRLVLESSWLIVLVTSLLEIFMAILIFINPFSNLLITEVSGIYFILTGILNSTMAILTRNRSIDFLEGI